MRRPAAALLLALLVLGPLALPSRAAVVAEGSYAVRVLPDPTTNVTPYDWCGLADAYVLGNVIGRDSRRLRTLEAGTLTVGVSPQANVFAGDLGLNWLVALYDSRFRKIAESRGPAWHHVATVRLARTQDVIVVVCNRWGYPDATVWWELRR